MIKKPIYEKHDRSVTDFQIKQYGRIADHDIVVPCLLFYDGQGEVADKNGTITKIDKKFIDKILESTNEYTKKLHIMPYVKHISNWSKPIDEVNATSLIMNHKIDEVENTVGSTVGLLYIDDEFIHPETQDTLYSLFVDVVIKDIAAKQAVESGLLRATSARVQPPSNRLIELSFVVDPALPLSGLMFSSEIDTTMHAANITHDLTINCASSNSQEIKALEFSAYELEHKTIPNHNIAVQLIKNGKMLPHMYSNAIKQERATLEFMAQAIPFNDVTRIFGTAREPEKIDKTVFEGQRTINEYKAEQNKKHPKQSNIQTQEVKPEFVEMIKQHTSYQEERNKELKHILQLAEQSDVMLKDYLKINLGESVKRESEKPDPSLKEYLSELKSINTKINKLKTKRSD